MFSPWLQLLENAFVGASAIRRVLAFWGPVVDVPTALVASLAAVSSVLVLAVLTGVAVGSLATLIVALTALYLLLTEVFGFSIDINVPISR